MTVIIGLKHEGKCYLGADSQVSAGWQKNTLSKHMPKIWRVGEFMVAFCGGVRRRQIAQYHSQTYRPHDVLEPAAIQDPVLYVMHGFVEPYRKALQEHGALQSEGDVKGQDDNAAIIVYQNHLFTLSPDFSLVSYNHDIMTSGSGWEYALGAMEALREYKLPPHEWLIKALEATAQYDIYVSAPFQIECY